MKIDSKVYSEKPAARRSQYLSKRHKGYREYKEKTKDFGFPVFPVFFVRSVSS